jgi:hypothetical protein
MIDGDAKVEDGILKIGGKLIEDRILPKKP